MMYTFIVLCIFEGGGGGFGRIPFLNLFPSHLLIYQLGNCEIIFKFVSCINGAIFEFQR